MYVMYYVVTVLFNDRFVFDYVNNIDYSDQNFYVGL